MYVVLGSVFMFVHFLQTSLRELFTAEESPRLESIEDITKQSDNNLSQKQVEEVMYMYIIHICIYTCAYIRVHIKHCTCTIHENAHTYTLYSEVLYM